MPINASLAGIIDAGDFAITAGIVPPQNADSAYLSKSAEELSGRVHAVLVSDGDGARMSGLAACVHFASNGIEPILELSTRDMNRIALESTIIGASSLGINSVFCTAGTHQTLTSVKEARGVFDLDPIQLLSAAQSLELTSPTLLGASTNPFSDPVELQILMIEKAVRAGARFAITAPVFDIEKMKVWLEAVRNRGLHEKIFIIAGVLPLETPEEAFELREKFRWLDIPDRVVDKIGIEFTAEMIRELKKLDGIRGIHIHPAGVDRAGRLLDAAELTTKR